MCAQDFFPGTKPSPSQHRLTETNFELAVPWQDLQSCPGRAGTGFISGKLSGARLACSLPDLRCFPTVLCSCFANREKKTKSQVPLCFQSCCPHRPCRGSDPHHSLAGGHMLGQGVFTADLGRGQLCRVEEELLFLASPCSVNWGMGSAWAHAKCHG